jgi:hypothetical protein
VPLEGVPHVLDAAQAVVADLRRSRTRTYQFSNRLEDGKAPPQLAGEQLSLVESSLVEPVGMQRHGDHATPREAFDDQALGHELGERAGQPAPSLVLETVDGVLDRTLVGDSRPKARQRSQATATAALPAGGRKLDPASPAERLLEPADLREAPIAQPRADAATATAPRGQQEIEDAHLTSVRTGSTGS